MFNKSTHLLIYKSDAGYCRTALYLRKRGVHWPSKKYLYCVIKIATSREGGPVLVAMIRVKNTWNYSHGGLFLSFIFRILDCCEIEDRSAMFSLVSFIISMSASSSKPIAWSRWALRSLIFSFRFLFRLR